MPPTETVDFEREFAELIRQLRAVPSEASATLLPHLWRAHLLIWVAPGENRLGPMNMKTVLTGVLATVRRSERPW